MKTVPIKSSLPSLKIHKGCGQAYVIVAGARRYLGKADRPEAQQRYAKLIAELVANGGRVPIPKSQITVAEVLAAFLEHAARYYVCCDGKPSKTVANATDHATRAWL